MLPYAHHNYVDARNEMVHIPPGVFRNREVIDLLDDMRIPNEIHFRNIDTPFPHSRIFDLTLLEREELLQLVADDPGMTAGEMTEAFAIWWVEAHRFPNVDFEAQLFYQD